MAEEKLDETVRASPDASDYQAPVIEEVVTRDVLEREVAYAGSIVGSQLR